MIDSVKGVCHVEFDYHASFLSADTAMDFLLDKDDIVSDLHMGNKTSLVLRDKMGDELFKSIS